MANPRTARRLLIIITAAAILTAVGPAQADAWKLGLKAGGHHPHAGKPWPLEVSARSGSGAPLHAKLLYQYLFAGQVVATGSPYGARSEKPYPFHGRIREKLKWPKRSIGYELTLRVLVRVKGHGKKHKGYKVKVRR